MAVERHERVAVCPGTFDPITYGHIDVIERAARLFDRVVVSVAINSGKQPLFSIEERLALTRAACSHLANVKVDQFAGLVVDHARQHGACALVKGLRVVSDFEREMQMALMNRALAENIPTIFLMSHADHAFLSSSIVKEVCSMGGDISDFVPPPVEQALKHKLAK
ncbi:MAG: pantetheine-phosphate adenylyltransferase [Candidatus Zipacnadales bacterium]